MPGANWDQIQELFLKAVDLPSTERSAFLAQQCLGDRSLRLEVESLLLADDAGEANVQAAIESELVSMLEEPLFVGARLGPYRLLEEIGRGGMGSVYLAERDDDEYRKRVAVKIVKRGMDTEEVLRRFRNERQILAGFDHPYIARLIDGGSTGDGRPFFVMEYVEGQPIVDYCSARDLKLESRLRLFVHVCEAVSYAHRSLVVHRDLKPSNILVNSDGAPKLLDFGVAKLLGPSVEPGLTAPSLSLVPLTAEYASPEQVRGTPVTTAADVYALGAILFELLTGVRAQRIDTHTPAEIERVVCETEISRPSLAARNAGTRRELDGDLDNIVLMAMRKEPESRYKSVDQLGEDILRYLDGRPVRARQASLGYRAQKFVRRHSLPLAAAVLIFVSIVGGATLAVTQARQAEAARRLAETQRQTAERERARAESETARAERERLVAESQTRTATTERDRAERRLTDLIDLSERSLYDVHSAIERLPGSIEARRQIVTTTLKFLEDLSRDAAQDDRLQFVLSVSYSKVASLQGYPSRPNLGDSTGAVRNYKRSLQLIEPLLRKEPERSEYVVQWLSSQLGRATVLQHAGDTHQSVLILQASLPVAQKARRLCPENVDCLVSEGAVFSALVEAVSSSDSAQALHYAQLQTQSLEGALKALPNDIRIQLELASAYSQEAKMWNTRAKLAEAADRYQRAIALREGAIQRNPTDVLTRRGLMITYGNLGGNLGNPLYPNLGDSAGAHEYYGKALAIARDLAKADANNMLAQYDLAQALYLYSVLDSSKDELPASLGFLREADGILQRVVAADPQSVSKLRPLAGVAEYEGRRLEDLGNRDEAIVQYRRSIAVAEKALERDPSDLPFISQLLVSQEALAEALARKGDYAVALAMVQAVVARAERVSSESDRLRSAPYIPKAYLSLARVHQISGNWREARAAAERSVDGYHQLVASGGPINRSEVTRAEALLQECIAHLQ